ncbi:TPA: hypothetical protein ACPVXP_004562 [Vibrio parahaemolyticus]
MSNKKRLPSNTAKGSKRRIETSCVAWFDLLGYGKMLRAAAFDPTHESTELAIQRLDSFQALIEKHTCKSFLTLALNDGGAAHRDLSPRDSSVTYDFIKRSFNLYNEINEVEFANGFPGVRMVVAAGFRIRRNRQTKNELLNGYAQRLIAQVDDNEISTKESIYKAITVKPFSAAVPELQANFAFSKAYIAESSGTKGGLPGPAMYLDSSLVKSLSPTGLSISEAIDWEYPGLDSTFLKIDEVLPVEASKNRYADIRNAFEVAEALSISKDVVSRLKSQPVRPFEQQTSGTET